MPLGLEIDGVGQHQPGEPVNGAAGNQVFNPLGRLFRYPVANGEAGVFRTPPKVHVPNLTPVIPGQGV